MGYSNYKTLKQVANKFELSVSRERLFEQDLNVTPSNWLMSSITLANTLPTLNEKSKSELLIAPILLEVYSFFSDRLTLFSGEELNIEPENDLNGPCDFFFIQKPNAVLLEAPIVSFTEAKNEDLMYGIAQCTAQMVGAQKFNIATDKSIPTIWGCATTAIEWKFLRLEDQKLTLDNDSYSIVKLDALLGVFRQLMLSVLEPEAAQS